jgi:CRP/FNR family transcriptional regulator, cyclic AMP receptor protein
MRGSKRSMKRWAICRHSSPWAVLQRRLVMLAEGHGEHHPDAKRTLEVTQEQLAAMLSSSRQSVNQALKELEQHGLVRVAYGQIVLVDLEALRAL